MKLYSLEDFGDKVDSLYRLVIIAARRATQISKPETRALVATSSKKSTVVALDEVYENKVSYRKEDGGEEDYEV